MEIKDVLQLHLISWIKKLDSVEIEVGEEREECENVENHQEFCICHKVLNSEDSKLEITFVEWSNGEIKMYYYFYQYNPHISFSFRGSDKSILTALERKVCRLLDSRRIERYANVTALLSTLRRYNKSKSVGVYQRMGWQSDTKHLLDRFLINWIRNLHKVGSNLDEYYTSKEYMASEIIVRKMGNGSLRIVFNERANPIELVFHFRYYGYDKYHGMHLWGECNYSILNELEKRLWFLRDTGGLLGTNRDEVIEKIERLRKTIK